MHFTDLLLSTVCSCPFPSTSIAEDDETNLKSGTRDSGTSLKNRVDFYNFFYSRNIYEEFLFSLSFI